jgi:hypothetical protein
MLSLPLKQAQATSERQLAMTGIRQGQEGSRWINYRPTGEEVKAWFETNVPIEDGLDVNRYVTGVTLIEATEKTNVVTGFNEETSLPIYREERHITLTPYVKVDTRVLYFYDLMKLKGWQGFIEPVEVQRIDNPESPYFNGHLPPGFFIFKVRKESDTVVTFVGCSMRVKIIDPNDADKPILVGPTGTKIVTVMGRYDVDENCVMKAETGAIGRALGAAGILVAPGSGIATAEDMQELEGQGGAKAVAEGASGESATTVAPSTESAELSPDDLRKQAAELVKMLRDDHPEAFAEFSKWANSREFTSVSSVPDHAIKGFVKKVEESLDAARKSDHDVAEDVSLDLSPGDEPEPAPRPEPLATGEPETRG